MSLSIIPMSLALPSQALRSVPRFTRLSVHSAHVAFGLMWISALMIRNAKRGLNLYTAPKFYVASLYWHFIDVVWVFIFTVVYLMGMVG